LNAATRIAKVPESLILSLQMDLWLASCSMQPFGSSKLRLQTNSSNENQWALTDLTEA